MSRYQRMRAMCALYLPFLTDDEVYRRVQELLEGRVVQAERQLESLQDDLANYEGGRFDLMDDMVILMPLRTVVSEMEEEGLLP